MDEKIETAILELSEEFDKIHQSFSKELAKVRTGRANLAMLDGIRVDYYGVPSPINQIAALSIPDPRLIVIKPWDKKMIASIEKAINLADIGLSPTDDGNVIRLPIPPLTMERRKELVKLIKKHGEEFKVNIRNSRRDFNEKLKKDKNIPEDDMYKGLDDIQKETDTAIKKIDDLIAAKEKEIMEF
jgi:ribosome recycling factor